MSLIRWTPTRSLPLFPTDILTMQRGINRMFDSFFRSGALDDTAAFSGWAPAVDVAEHDDRYEVVVELPGVSKDEVSIVMRDDLLMIRGDKKQEKESKGSNYHRVERSFGSFQRTFTLPAGVKQERIDASFNDGVLTVVLPKAEEAKPRQIEVKVR